MRYERDQDWVEIEGASRLPYRQLVKLDFESFDEAFALAVKVTADAHFVSEDDPGVAVDWRTDFMGLSPRQWRWWKRQIWAATREEKIDPEA